MITFTHVTKHFGIGEPALNDVSFTIEPGEFVFLAGHSGAGKTTIARLLTKEYVPTEGEIEFDGTILSEIPRSQLHHHRRRIGVIYQDYKLLPEMTVRENIALPLHIIGKSQDETEQRISDLLELVGLTDKIDLFPSQLSGGEAQRISIARALATAPMMLFADEPTGNLDRDTSNIILQILKKVNQVGTTVIMATHDDQVLQDEQHRVFYLKGGNLDIREPKQPKAKKEAKKVKDEELSTENEEMKEEPRT